MSRFVPLCICLTGLFLYVCILFFYIIRIRVAKRRLPAGTAVPKPGRSFWGIFAAALALIILPVLILLPSYLIATVCACGLLGEYLALKDRLEQIGKLCDNP